MPRNETTIARASLLLHSTVPHNTSLLRCFFHTSEPKSYQNPIFGEFRPENLTFEKLNRDRGASVPGVRSLVKLDPMANLGGEPPPFGFLPKPTDFLAEERTFLAWIRTSLGTPRQQLQRCHCLLFEYEPHGEDARDSD